MKNDNEKCSSLKDIDKAIELFEGALLSDEKIGQDLGVVNTEVTTPDMLTESKP